MPDDPPVVTADDPVCVAAEEYNAELRRQQWTATLGPTPPTPPRPGD